MMKDLNKIFEEWSPKDLVTGIESTVGLLRNCRNATPVDVELFLSDPAKLISKLKRFESHGLTYKNVLAHRDELAAVVGKFEKDEKPIEKGDFNLFPFLPLIKWAHQFSIGAEIELKKE